MFRLSDNSLDTSRRGVPAVHSEALLTGALFLLALILFVLFTLGAWTRPILDPDYWWLRWAGEQMLHGHYPRLNALSWTAPQAEWITHEPLVELAYALVGARGAVLLRGLVLSATALLLGAIAWRPRSAFAALLSYAWVTELIIFGRTERALSWGNLMLALTVALLQGKPSKWRLGLAALVVAISANVHGSFVVGLFVLVLASWRWGVIAGLLTLLNPAGWRLWELVLGYGTSAGTKPFVHDAIPEWFAPDFSQPTSLFHLALLFLGGALILWRGPWRGRIAWTALTILTLQHQRFMDLAAIASLPWLVDALASLLPARPMRSPVAACAALGVAMSCLMPSEPIDAARFPSTLHFDRLAGRRVWNDYTAGGFLGYHGVKVFWDPRVDCYPLSVLEAGWQIEQSDKERMDLLARWGIDTVVTAHPTIAQQLAGAGWVLTESAAAWRVYERPEAGSGGTGGTAAIDVSPAGRGAPGSGDASRGLAAP